jgi:presequence protease
MNTALTSWLHDEFPLKNLKFVKPLADLVQKISVSGSKVFQDMVETLLLKNMHRATIEMVSSTSMEAGRVKDEEMRLAAIKASMSDEELRQVIAKTVEFKEYLEVEDSPEVLATTPTLELSDLVIETNDYPIAVTKNEANSGVEVTRHEFEFTGGLAYVSLGFDISMLSLEEAALLPLVTNIMMIAGAGEYNSVELSERIGIYTGGLDISVLYTSVKDTNLEENVVTDGDFMITKLVFSGKALSENIDVLFSLFLLILNDSILDVKETFLEIIEDIITATEVTFGYYAGYYITTRIESRYTAERYIVEKLDGISQLVILKSLLELGKKDWSSLSSILEKIRHSIVNNPAVRDGSFLDITGDSAVMKTIQPAVERLLESLPDSKNRENALDFYSQIHPWILAAKLEMSEEKVLIDEGIIITTQVSYVGKGGLIYNIGEKVTGSDLVVLQFLSSEFLHDEIRVIGGAYGAESTLSQPRFILVFNSYRDPNISQTLDVYDAAYEALMSAADEFEEYPQLLVPFQIGTLGLTDAAIQSSAAKGWRAFTDNLKRISKNERQTVRDEIVKAKASDFRDFAHRVRKMKDSSIAIILSNESVDVVTEDGLTLKYTELF